MLPEGFIKRIRSQDHLDAEILLPALEKPSPVSIRINTTKWARKPLKADKVTWCSSGFYLDSRPSYTFDPLFHAGCYYPQEASGMFLEEVFNQIEALSGYIRVLDLCGAPGGKSTHLASLIGTHGLLVANEVIKSRATILAENIAKWGITNTIVSQCDPSDFRFLPGFFDIIVVDAPCSGEGMFSDPFARKEWSQENTIHCSERQKRILFDVWPAIRENGYLIYSTCTFNPGENEENIKWLVKKQMAESVEIKISSFDGIKEIDHQGIKGYGFHPGSIRGEGFFISVIRKNNSSGTKKVRNTKLNFPELKKSDMDIVKRWSDFRKESILKFDDQIISFHGKAGDYNMLIKSLKIIRSGTMICKTSKDGYVPSHELSLSDSFRNDGFPSEELDYNQAINYLRRENFISETRSKGWFLLTYKGINLGFCNNIGRRINNYYPVEWRIKSPLSSSAGRNIIEWEKSMING